MRTTQEYREYFKEDETEYRQKEPFSASGVGSLMHIVLWSLAAAKDPSYIPVIINFAIFFFNDMYGFICWKKREREQEEKCERA